MSPNPLTVIVKIKPEEEANLKSILEAIDSDPANNPYVRFPESRQTHLARFAILNDPDNGPRLLFSSNYDGDLDSYLNELIQISPGMDSLWEKCQGYTGKAQFSEFINQHSYQPEAFYIAFRNETVESLKNYIAIRKHIENFLDLKDVANYLDCSGIKPFLDKVALVSQTNTWWEVVGLNGLKILRGLVALGQGILNLIRQILLVIINFLASILGKPENRSEIGQYTSVKADLAQSQLLANAEDRFVQNSMNHLVDINPERLKRLKIVLFLVNWAGQYLFPPASLVNITTIHFARWLIIDEGKRLLFLSNYDGSWDNYLNDFVDRASDGLNSIWNNTMTYPEGGAQDIGAFKQYFRDYQTPSLVYYSAYPEQTVQTSLRDQQISKMIGTNFNQSAVEEWLKLL